VKINISNIRNLKDLLKNLATILLNLDFSNNFNSYEVVDIELPANTETKIRHGLGKKPTKKILTKCSNYGIIKDGTTVDDVNFVYFVNSDASESLTISILLL
jgi:hypothetical protein